MAAHPDRAPVAGVDRLDRVGRSGCARCTLAPSSASVSAAQYQPYVASRTTSGHSSARDITSANRYRGQWSSRVSFARVTLDGLSKNHAMTFIYPATTRRTSQTGPTPTPPWWTQPNPTNWLHISPTNHQRASRKGRHRPNAANGLSRRSAYAGITTGSILKNANAILA